MCIYAQYFQHCLYENKNTLMQIILLVRKCFINGIFHSRTHATLISSVVWNLCGRPIVVIVGVVVSAHK